MPRKGKIRLWEAEGSLINVVLIEACEGMWRLYLVSCRAFDTTRSNVGQATLIDYPRSSPVGTFSTLVAEACCLGIIGKVSPHLVELNPCTRGSWGGNTHFMLGDLSESKVFLPLVE